jgi:hypothetical protein
MRQRLRGEVTVDLRSYRHAHVGIVALRAEWALGSTLVFVINLYTALNQMNTSRSATATTAFALRILYLQAKGHRFAFSYAKGTEVVALGPEGNVRIDKHQVIGTDWELLWGTSLVFRLGLSQSRYQMVRYSETGVTLGFGGRW